MLKAEYIFVTHGTSDIDFLSCEGRRIIQLWHGIPLKHISWDDWNLSLQRKILEKYIKSLYVFVLASSPLSVEPMSSGLRIDTEDILVNNYPRIDVLNNEIPDSKIGGDQNLIELIGCVPSERSIYVYMPTYRREHEGRRSPPGEFDFQMIDELMMDINGHFIISTHPKETLDVNPDKFDNISISQSSGDIYPALPYTDCLITDYSSIFFDYLHLNNPVIFYPYDIDEYKTARGFYFDYQSITPGPIAKNFDELVDALRDTSNEYNNSIYSSDRADIKERFYLDTAQTASSDLFKKIINL